jgi:hypothetical protein
MSNPDIGVGMRPEGRGSVTAQTCAARRAAWAPRARAELASSR